MNPIKATEGVNLGLTGKFSAEKNLNIEGSRSISPASTISVNNQRAELFRSSL
ncbi:hypothetical protein BB560_007224 [Smittium megazygosporum]|uniref:Uncharacterized protein n=1 Tax=Smittium megazygosporum TaxID=133381 RepID=A0A2T9XXT2_9FUNG|nr:hypothetical protein BB560_007224 [Smittium megazygosporum]